MVVATSATIFLLFHGVAAGKENGGRLTVALLAVADPWSCCGGDGEEETAVVPRG